MNNEDRMRRNKDKNQEQPIKLRNEKDQKEL